MFRTFQGWNYSKLRLDWNFQKAVPTYFCTIIFLEKFWSPTKEKVAKAYHKAGKWGAKGKFLKIWADKYDFKLPQQKAREWKKNLFWINKKEQNKTENAIILWSLFLLRRLFVWEFILCGFIKSFENSWKSGARIFLGKFHSRRSLV